MEFGLNRKDGHSAFLQFRWVSLAQLFASKVGFGGSAAQCRFHPKVARKLLLSVDTKCSNIASIKYRCSCVAS